LEFGSEPVQAIRFFADYGDETAVPLLVGKLLAPDLGQEARKAIIQIGEPSLSLLMEVLISPLQSIALKDEVASILGEMGDVVTVPALRTYVREYNTDAGRRALLMLEEQASR